MKLEKIFKNSIITGLVFFVLLEYIFYFITRQLIVNSEFEVISLFSFLYISAVIFILLALSQKLLSSKKEIIRKSTFLIMPISSGLSVLIFMLIFIPEIFAGSQFINTMPYTSPLQGYSKISILNKLFTILSYITYIAIIGLIIGLIIPLLVLFISKLKFLFDRQNKKIKKFTKIAFFILLLFIFLFPTYKIMDRLNIFGLGLHEYATCRGSTWHIDAAYKRPLIYGKPDVLITEVEERGEYECHVIKDYIKPTFVVLAHPASPICQNAIAKYYIDDKEYDTCHTKDGLSSPTPYDEAVLTVGHNLKLKYSILSTLYENVCEHYVSKEMCYKEHVNLTRGDVSVCKKMGNQREKCYFNFAIEKQNQELCKKAGKFKDKCLLNLELLKENLSPKELRDYLDTKVSKEIKVERGAIYNVGTLGFELGEINVGNLDKYDVKSEKFQLYINHYLEADKGCMDGIGPTGWCSLNFIKPLEVDDVLEIVYDGETVLVVKIKRV